ncbi:MAG TPA: BatA domain-containing protein [Gemmatimonadales bacterium]|jgi:hypothetical protein
MPLTFLGPALLAGLAALGVPLVLHLRRRERERPMRFPSLMFLQRIKTSTARRRRITDLPLLLLRALIVALAVLAFARPVWRERAAAVAPRSARRIVLLIDHSLSMGHLAVWPAARDSARAVVAALAPDDRIAVIAFDDDAVVEQGWTSDRAAARAAVDRIAPDSRATRFSAGLRAARDLLEREADRRGGEVILVSDLQRTGATGATGLTLPPGVTLRVIAASHGSHANGSVSGITVQRDSATENRRARLVVSATIASRNLVAPRATHATLLVGGRPVGSRAVTLPTTGTTTVAFDAVALPLAGARVVVSIDHDSLTADDSRQAMVPPQLVRRVILVSPADATLDETLYLERAVAAGSDPAMRVERRNAASLDAGALQGTLAVILDDVPVPGGAAGTALTAWVHDGGGLLVIAGTRTAGRGENVPLLPATVHGVVDRTSSGGGMLGAVALEHPVFAPFRGAASSPLGQAHFYRYARATPVAGAEVVARFDDGLPALLERAEGTGHVMLTTVPLDATSGDFVFQPTYPAYVRSILLHLAGAANPPLARTVGEAWAVPPGLHDPVIRTPAGEVVRPEGAGAVMQLDEAGFYAAYDGKPSGDPAAVIATNPASAESDLATMPAVDLVVGVGNDSLPAASATAAALLETERHQMLWRTLLVLAGLALVSESWLASRGWRGAAVRVAGSEGGSA